MKSPLSVLQTKNNNKNKNIKYCLHCGSRIYRGLMRGLMWDKRQYCNKECRSKDKTAIQDKPIKRLRRKLGESYNIYKCCLCGEEIVGNRYQLKRHKFERHGH